LRVTRESGGGIYSLRRSLLMLPGCCGGRRFRWWRAWCAAVRRGWRSLLGLLSARADLAAVGSGARLPCRHCGLRPVLPRLVVRAAGGALSVVSPYRRSPLPFPGFRGQRRSWGITLFRLLGGYPSLPSGISDSTRETRRFQCGDSAVPVRFQSGAEPRRAEPNSVGAKSQYHREIAPCYCSPSAPAAGGTAGRAQGPAEPPTVPGEPRTLNVGSATALNALLRLFPERLARPAGCLGPTAARTSNPPLRGS
jgi:hypothetical protein